MVLRNLFLVAVLGIFGLSADEPGHAVQGTCYGKENVLAYATNRHGPDGALFLDPFFIPYLEHLDNQLVLDAGCGSAPWAIYAAQHGATVFGIDFQEKMIEVGQAAAKTAGVSDKVALVVGDVADLPCVEGSFDLSLSINVGCNLPSTTQVNGKTVGLGPHVKEMARVLKPGGVAIVTGPASFGTVFTDGSSHEKVMQHIKTVLGKLPTKPTTTQIVTGLNELKEVYRATFALVNGKLTLITQESDVEPGQEIWRKLPGLAVPNRYHPETEYLSEFAEAGLTVKECYHPQFHNPDERSMHNAPLPATLHLGDEYIDHNPFVIFCLTKSSS